VLHRFLRFNLVSGLGVFVQLAAVTLLVEVLGLHYLVGTALAIEIAVLHNFAWHERWTWRDKTGRLARSSTRSGRRKTENGSVFFRCLVFHAGNGCVSLLGSLALLPLLVGVLHLHYVAGNLVTIAATGLLNFLISDRVVFRGVGSQTSPT
jgi:putative flippase GtrA